MNMGSLIAGLVFIILGVLFLLDNLGVFEVSFAVIWPIVLIGVGLALLLGGLGRRRQETPPPSDLADWATLTGERGSSVEPG